MLAGLVTWILNNYLGKYVHLNTDQLSIALLSGKVELENVPLKINALRHLGLPLVIRSGFIGKLKLQIPLRQIRSAPWVIVLEQLYVVVSPLPINEWDHDSEQTLNHDIKIKALDTLEAKWRLDQNLHNSNFYASSYSSWYNYGTSCVSQIIENLQLHVQDVHIRYEDNLSDLEQSVACGITINSLTVQSCDHNWIPGFVQASEGDYSYKLLELHSFAFYWITLSEGESYANLNVTQLTEAINAFKTKQIKKQYIIPSVSAHAHLKENRSTQPLRSETTPRIICELILDEIPISFIDWQYNQIVNCIRNLENIGRLREYRKYKPNCTLGEDPRAWWLYAISCFYPSEQPRICKPKVTWESCLERARQNIKYVQLYKKLLEVPTATLSNDERKIKDEIEWERDFEDLKVLREIAMENVKLPVQNVQNKSTGRSMLESWFPQWIGWYSSSTEVNGNSSIEAAQLEGEILQVLSDTAENNTTLKRDSVFGRFTFCLKSGTINLLSFDQDLNDITSMLELEFKNLSLTVVSKPRTSSHLIELSLEALNLKDKITRNTMFPILVGPPGSDRISAIRTKVSSGLTAKIFSAGKLDDIDQPLFNLVYEKNPTKSSCDNRLSIKTKSLDVVYQPNAVKWLIDFICLPHHRTTMQSHIAAMKYRTKKELIKNWEQILEGRVFHRSTWELELDISAPQIIFAEDFTDQNSAMAIIDFGKLHLRNNYSTNQQSKPEFGVKESDDDETFLTPCSTPPVTENSASSESEPVIKTDLAESKLDESSFHNKLYDCYSLELNELQILIGKAKENWRYALNKGTSVLHVLDRFNISLQIERRVIYTSDPLYPSLTFNANLPKLVVHLNESKIISARNLFHLISSTGLGSPFTNPDLVDGINLENDQISDETISVDSSMEMSKLVMMQFTVDHMSLDLQSRGRSVAELQVAGVKIAFTKRALDTSITLTVHSLLLVDALQTFGPDFELLVASHKHVGMDSMSGSLRDSEPTSPTSPNSPDPNATRQNGTSQIALTQALRTINSNELSKWPSTLQNGLFLDNEALITVEICMVSGAEPIQIANIQFNSLDIIANQETIVELVGFVKRVFPKSQKSSGLNFSSVISTSVMQSTESLLEEDISSNIGRTELTFDFHRLNVLLLRGVVKDGTLVGKKICTATMSEAKIHVTLAENFEVEGSLGGLQVLDLTPEGQMHQRIISVGRDLLLETPHPIYLLSMPQEDERRAFSFSVIRNLDRNGTIGTATGEVIVRMASLWYTHSPKFLVELQNCATEFKQYLSNLARSIRLAATDVALGLVHARAEALAQSLSMNKRLPSSIYGSALSFSDIGSPGRRRRRSSSYDGSGYASAKETMPQTPYSPGEEEHFTINVKLDIELDSPVLVLPRSNTSTEVFVAHLGKININNNFNSREDSTNGFTNDLENKKEYYDIEIKDMNIFSLDTSSRRSQASSIRKPEILYSCKTLAKPILHDTVLQLNITRVFKSDAKSKKYLDNILLDDECDDEIFSEMSSEMIEISGSIITELKLSLTRTQYEQIIDTLQWHTSVPILSDTQGISRANIRPQSALTDISEEDAGVTTLNMDPHVRAKLFFPSSTILQKSTKNTASHANISWKLNFEMPLFVVELRGNGPNGEQGLVDLSFREFEFNYEKCEKYETTMLISLKSICMEDLLQPESSRQRSMVTSSFNSEQSLNSLCVSRSCPDVTFDHHMSCLPHGSLPDHLETVDVFGMGGLPTYKKKGYRPKEHNHFYPSTPPPTPNQRRKVEENNLVLISSLIVDPAAPNFETQYNSVKQSTSIDFSCLDLVISVPSWLVVLDFFSGSPSYDTYSSTMSLNSITDDDDVFRNNATRKAKIETNIKVCSLTMALVKPEQDIARANISKVEVMISTCGSNKEVKGKLGSISLLDMTLHGQIYKERFLTSGKEVLQFEYSRNAENETKAEFDAELKLEMASIMYVHTKRFMAEIEAFFLKFTNKQTAVMKGIQAATSRKLVSDHPLRLSLNLKAGSPIILLPVSSKSVNLLVIDLGQLVVSNTFKFSGDLDTVSVVSNTESDRRCLLEVLSIDLQNMDLYTGIKENDANPSKMDLNKNSFKFGSSFIMRKGPSLLTKKFELKLQYEKNLQKDVCHIVPDSSIYGHLSTLDCTLDLHQYILIRGILSYNLGEDTDKIYPLVPLQAISLEQDTVEEWIVSSIKLDMQNVSLRLVKSHSESSPLACINFIKSHLTIETFSNLSQDVDLVSQEILILDTRFQDAETKSKNVFINILQPIKDSETGSSSNLVQAEIHSRKRQDHFKVTVLLNNMRLMAIFDWWEAIREYIFQEIDHMQTSPEHVKLGKTSSTTSASDVSFELKLNVTDSELVLVENSSQWDTNAVILKSTTVVKYSPNNIEKPLSCSLNNCEMFSCVLGIEDDTALSIIDPITLNIDIVRGDVLEVQLQFLTIRLSYNDVCMFRQMLDSLPKQLFNGKEKRVTQTPTLKNMLQNLMNMGFKAEDCLKALELCDNRLEDAAIWLTLNVKVANEVQHHRTAININSIEVKSDCISICIIDDCGDSDVPLMELVLSDLKFKQNLFNLTGPATSNGYLHGIFSSDYYNRALSGWEPIIEPWNSKISWEIGPSQITSKDRLALRIESDHIFDINITSTFLNLYKQVKENWINDFMKQGMLNSDGSFRQRSPFIPFALKNDTGSPLMFTIFMRDLNTSSNSSSQLENATWISANPGETIPIHLTSRDKLRHQDSHKLRMHNLAVKLDGWQSIEPVTVDKVGTYFRDVPPDIQTSSNRCLDIPYSRIIFNVTLEGSARKLITVRSGLIIINNLPHSVEAKLESRLPHNFIPLWLPTRNYVIEPKASFAVPVGHAYSLVNIRPIGFPYQFTFSTSTLMSDQTSDQNFFTGSCHTHKGHSYRFCSEIIKEKTLIERNTSIQQPTHRIILLPRVKIINLLPVDINYILSEEKGFIPAGTHEVSTVADTDRDLTLQIKLDNFLMCNTITISPNSSDFNYRIKLIDNKQRKLYLMAEILFNKDAKVNIRIYASYWIINRTGLPLVFKQSGTSLESAGQFDEHEQARMVAPLLFSFSEQDDSHMINARIGKRVVWDGTPQWCSHFHVQKGTQYRKLHVTLRESRSERVFIVGIEVRSGKGKYRGTNIISITPRYQLHNKSSYNLAFAQAYLVKDTTNNNTNHKSFLKAMPNWNLPFHWSRLDKEQLLCVSIEDIPNCGWSGGFKIDSITSMHINIRDATSRVYFIRLEVVLQGATFYIIFTDADKMPPPIRVDNFSEVSINFAQNCTSDMLSTARAHSSVPYAWDEPTGPHYIKLIAPGGLCHKYNMNNLGSIDSLTYDNFIYIAFVGTFKNVSKLNDFNDVESQELVLDVTKNNIVILAKKVPGQRSQLWKLTSKGYLQHEGSSPPNHPNAYRSQDNILVLDIADTAPQPDLYCSPILNNSKVVANSRYQPQLTHSVIGRLTLRRMDPRRQSTQRWHFTNEGRLCCDHFNMCVQAEDGFYGLREGSRAVLGLPHPTCHKLTDKNIPIEQAIEPQKLRPGSGLLAVTITMDGPTQVITIKDTKEKRIYALPDDREWGTISQRPKLTLENEEDDMEVEARDLQFNINLKGVGVSLVCRKGPEELLYAYFADIVAETIITAQSKQFCVSVRDIQINNQLLDAVEPVVLYVTPPRTNEEVIDYLPAIDFKAEIQNQLNENAVIFKHLILRLKKITAIIEEKLLLKLFDFFNFGSKEDERINEDENDYETQRLVSEVSATTAKRYYFSVLKLIPNEIVLSVKTSNKLSENLHRIKKQLGLTLIKFEDAAILLEPFDRKHPFETSQFLFKSIMKHFKDELIWQAGVILGSIDFIGNPLGLVNDVSEGVSGLLQGNVRALVKNVTHGLSNSTAKVAESLSDGLGKFTMDDYHEEMRQRIRQVESGNTSDHILAGLKGLGFGLLGGATGIFKQIYEGASNDGIQGAVSGLGKGVVGAFTKPVVGVLDFASETAMAVRDSSRSKLVPERRRLPRCVHGTGSLLPRYDPKHSHGQQYLYAINGKNYDEKLLAFEVLGSASEDLLCIVSDKMIRIVTAVRTPELTAMVECSLSDLETCNVLKDKEKGEYRYYIEIVMHYAGINAAVVNPDPIKRPRVRCRSLDLAISTAQQINYAKTLYFEHLYTLKNEEVNVLYED